jgi:hypothetical protein
VSVPTPAIRPKQKFGCGFIVFPIILIVLGIAMVSAGRQLAPDSNAAAEVFRTDPSCTADLTARVPPGACRTVAATVLLAEMRTSYEGGKTPIRTPMVHLRFADGSFHDAELDGSAGDVFVYSVRPGALARAQLFRGDLVRVTSGNDSAETVSAPSVDAETVNEMPWVGAAAIVIALLIFFLRVYVVRRAA